MFLQDNTQVSMLYDNLQNFNIKCDILFLTVGWDTNLRNVILTVYEKDPWPGFQDT